MLNLALRLKAVAAASFSLPDVSRKRRRKASRVLIFILLGKGQQHSAEATDDFKMSFSSSLPCNSAAALKEKQIAAFKSQPP